jgi:hypothetical protein
MAIIAATTDRNTAAGATLVTWDAMATGDSGAPFGLNAAADITIQVTGTFGGSTVTFQGSNDGTNWHALTQRAGTGNMAYTAAANHACNEMPAFIRPNITGGTGSAFKVIAAIFYRYGKSPL